MKLVAWLSATLAASDPPSVPVNPGLTPVVLVHGIDGSERDMARLARAMRATGRLVLTPSLTPNDGSAPLEELSAQLRVFLNEHLPEGPFDLVGYSMGALVARHHLLEGDPAGRVRRFVSISAPHRGTLTAWLRQGEGIRQMRPGSRFLRALEAAETSAARPAAVTSFQTVTDLIIVPFTSGCLSGAENIRLLGWGHVSGILEPRCMRRVIVALNG